MEHPKKPNIFLSAQEKSLPYTFKQIQSPLWDWSWAILGAFIGQRGCGTNVWRKTPEDTPNLE